MFLLQLKTLRKSYQFKDRWQDHPYLYGVFPTKKHKLEFAAFASSLALFLFLSMVTSSTSSALSIGAKGMAHVPTVEKEFQVETIKSSEIMRY